MNFAVERHIIKLLFIPCSDLACVNPQSRGLVAETLSDGELVAAR